MEVQIIKPLSPTYYLFSLCPFLPNANTAQPCISTPYHHPLSQAESQTRTYGKKKMVSLSAPADSDHPQLFYTPEEFTDVVQRLNSSFTCPMALTADAIDYLFQISNGHPAAVQALMRYIYSVRITLSMSFTWAHIFQAYQPRIKHGEILIVAQYHVVEALENHATLFNSLNTYPIYRSFPSADRLTPQAVGVLRDTLLYKSIPCDLNQPGVRLCYEQGWLHSEPADPTKPEDLVCVLPSKLHER